MITETETTISRTYRGRKGMTTFHADAERNARRGYVVASQVQTPGGRTASAQFLVGLGVLFLVAGLLFIPLWGLAVVCLVIGLVSKKKPDDLSIVWVRPA